MASANSRQKVSGLYFTYWSLCDPLCQTQSLAYLRQLTRRGLTFALITFEQPQYALGMTERAAMQERLLDEGISWYPLRYHKRWPLAATAYDCLAGVWLGLRLARELRPAIVHARSSVPAAMGFAVAGLARLKFLYDADSSLADEYAATGHWSPRSAAYWVTSWCERQARSRATAIVVLTERMRRRMIDTHGVDVPVSVIPCCVDTNVVRFDSQAREVRRRELGVGEEKLFVYVGKWGPRYLVPDLFRFFRVASARIGGARLLVLTADAPALFERAAAEAGIDPAHVRILRSSREHVSGWLSAADAGLAFIQPTIAECGSAPIKVGEYLATGLPVVITPEIGDYSGWIAESRLGVVVEDLTDAAFEGAASRLQALWREGDGLRARCRETAERRLALNTVGLQRYLDVYSSLMDPRPALGAAQTGSVDRVAAG